MPNSKPAGPIAHPCVIPRIVRVEIVFRLRVHVHAIFVRFYALLIVMVINTTSCLCGENITVYNYRHGSKTSVTSGVAFQKSPHTLITVKLTVYFHVVNILESQVTFHNILFSGQWFCCFRLPAPGWRKRQLPHLQQK